MPVRRSEQFGLIVQFTSSKDGLCHKTELEEEGAGDPSTWSEGDLIDVQLLEVGLCPQYKETIKLPTH